MSRLLAPRVGPRRWHKFHGGEVFMGEETSVTPGRQQQHTFQTNEQTQTEDIANSPLREGPLFRPVMVT